MKKFGALMALLYSLFAMLMLFAAIGDLFSGDAENPGIVAGLAIFFAITAFFGTRWGWRTLNEGKPKAATEEDRQKEVLRLAAQNGGQLSVSQLCNMSSLSLDDSQQALDDMMRKQVADIIVDDDGAIFYRFQGLLGSGSK